MDYEQFHSMHRRHSMVVSKHSSSLHSRAWLGARNQRLSFASELRKVSLSGRYIHIFAKLPYLAFLRGELALSLPTR